MKQVNTAGKSIVTSWLPVFLIVAFSCFGSSVVLAADYTLTVSLNDNAAGSVTATGINCPGDCTEDFDETASVTLTANENAGWQFVNWTDNGGVDNFDGSTTSPVTFQMGAALRNVTANFQKITYTLTTSQVGNGTVTADTTYVYDDHLAVLANPASGWEFVNWTGTGVGNLEDMNSASTNIVNPTASATTIIANFQKITYTLTTSQVGNGTVTADTTYVYDEHLAVLATPASGWEFVNWTGMGAVNLENVNSASTNIINPTTSDTIVTANFQKITYTLTTSQVGNGTVTADTTYVYDEHLAVLATPASGWEFVNWTGTGAVNLENVNSASTNIINPTTSDTIVTANFQKITYTLTTSQVGNGTVTADTTYVYDEHLAVLATPASGWELVNWTGTGVGNLEDVNSASTNIVNPTTSNTAITANFQKITYTLTTSQVGNGTVTADTTYVHDDHLAVFATPDPGWEFVNWTGSGAVNLEDVNSASTNIVNPTTSNTAITANFQKITYTLTTSQVGNGTVTADTTYVYDDHLAVLATPASGWEFVNWTGTGAVNLEDVNSASTNIVNPTISNTTVTANFIHIEYPLIVTVQGVGTVTKNPDQATYHYNDIVQLTANPGGSEFFRRWELDLSGAVNPEDHTIHAGTNQVHAVFGHTITASAGADGSISPDGIVEVDSGTNQSFSITPDTGYCTEDVVVDGVSVGHVTNYSFYNVTANHTIDATFREIFTFTGYVEPSVARTIGRWRLFDDDTNAAITGWKKHGETVNIPCGTVNVRVEYNSENCGSQSMPVNTITPGQPMAAAPSLTATGTYDVPTYDLTLTYGGTGDGTVSADPAGGSCDTDCPQTYTYPCNTTITVRAVPDGISHFDHWDGDVDDPINYVTTITLFSDQTVTAIFENVQYTLSMAVFGNGSVSPAVGTHQYDPDTEVNLIATPDPGYEFVEWQGSVVDATSQTTTILMNADQTVNAVFQAAVEPAVDNDGDGYTENDGDCNDYNAAVHPGATEICGDGIDQDCDGIDPACLIDNDGDGFLPGPNDCDDNDPTIYLGAPEICGDGIDQDCDGSDTICTGDDGDIDGDGYSPNTGDCDDGNAAIHPGAVDICGDGIDQDCYDGDRDCDTADTCVTIDDKPLNAQIQAAAANVMFLLDDSGSMDWSILRENGNVYRGYDYLFDNPGDHAYGPESQTVMSRSERRDYLSQWNGDNNMYYNPGTYYFSWADNTHTWNPASTDFWPSMADADPDFPRSNPMTAQTLDFRSTADVLAASEELIPYTTLWDGGGQRVEVARVDDSTGSYTWADAVRLSHVDAPTEVRVSGNNDDAEEQGDGDMYLPSNDLDMICDGYDGGAIGIRFAGVMMPTGWDPITNPITDARVVFTADVSGDDNVSLRFSGELSDDSSAFTTGTSNITGRAETGATVDWNNVPAWTAGQEYTSPDLHHIVNDVASQAGWLEGNAMTFIVREISGGCRIAVAHERDPARAPLLILKTATTDDTAPNTVIDNNDSLFQWDGSSWRNSTHNSAWDRKYFYTSRGDGAEADHTATWLLNIEKAGPYRVYAWVPERNNSDSNAPYTVYFNGGASSATVRMDQRLQPAGNAGEWHELLKTAMVTADAGAGVITLTVADTGYVPDVATYTYTFTVQGDTTEYTLQAGTTLTSLVFTPALAADVAANDVIIFNQWWTFTVPADPRASEVVHRSHYYTKDAGDNVYLVILDTHDISRSSLGRSIKYYLWEDDNNNNVVDYGELTLTAAPPDEVKPKKNYVSVATAGAIGASTLSTVEDVSLVPVGTTFIIGNATAIYTVIAGTAGTTLHISPALVSAAAAGAKVKFSDPSVTFDRTYEEEKQNFVNWYSFFRRRELTAKAAVGRVIADMSGVKIGIHTIHERVNQEVLPVKSDDWNERVYDYVAPATPGFGDPCAAANQYCDETDLLLTQLYTINSTGGTPLRRGLERVGRYFDADDGDVGISGTSGSPYDDVADGGECQQAFAIAMTDGYYNGGEPNIDGDGDSDTHANADGDGNTLFDGAPYGDEMSDTLADVAMYFYERDLSTALNDMVPRTNTDQNSQQHMVTYGVAFGVVGSLPDSGSCPPGCTWPTNMNNQGKIDDLFHAAVNGRGSFFTAKDPQELVDALLAIKDDIELKIGSGAAVGTTPSGQLSSDTFVFQGTYNPEFWSGDIKAYQLYSLEEEEADKEKDPVDQEGIIAGTVKVPHVWSADDTINVRRDVDGNWWNTDREVITFNGNKGVPFRMPADPVNPTNEEITLGQLGLLGDTTAERLAMINYLRGEIANEQPNGESYRSRGGNIFGDFIHSAPIMVETHVQTTGDGIDNNGDGNVDEAGESEALILAGANDGGLHVFNPDDDGEELLFYIPGLLYADATGQGYLKKLAIENPNYSHQYYVDGTVYARQVGEADSDPVLAVGGLGKGGKGYYLLNVSEISTNPDELNASDIVKWEYPNGNLLAEDKNPLSADYLSDVPMADSRGLMGYSFAQAYIVRSNADEDANPDTVEWMVVFGNGYESPSGEAALIILGIDGNGDIQWRREINTGDPLAGQITQVTVTDSGSGYTVLDPVGFTGGSGAGASGHVAAVFDAHDIQTVTITGTGTGYAVGEVLTVTGGSGTGAGISVDSVNAGGAILTWSVVNGGTGYTASDVIGFSGSVAGSGAAATVDSTGTGSIATIAVDNDGYGYDGSETVDFTGGSGSGATATITVRGVTAMCNGLSSTALIDVNFDARVDFAYAGDLYGNMWKFDLRSNDPANWQIAYCDGAQTGSYDPSNPGTAYGCVESHPGVVPQPLVTVQYNQMHHDTTDYWESTIQPITVEPDVIVPCVFGQDGYLVTFGTGRYISDNEINDKSGQTIYGIWDWAREWIDSGMDTEPYERYLGTIELPTTPEAGLVVPYPATIRKLSEPSALTVTRGIPDSDPEVEVTGTGVSLLEQVQITGEADINDAVYRVLSQNPINWYSPENNEGEHVGWFFNLPGRGERVVTGLSVRDGILDIISSQPSPSACSGGIVSIIHGIDACNGGRPDSPYFDINGDGIIDSDDMVNIGSEENPVYVSPTGLYQQGMVYSSSAISIKGTGTAVQVRSISDASLLPTRTRDERKGLVFWREIN